MEVDVRQKYYRETVFQIFVFHFMWILEFDALDRLRSIMASIQRIYIYYNTKVLSIFLHQQYI